MYFAGSGLISVMEAHLVVAMLHIRLIAQRYSDGVGWGISSNIANKCKKNRDNACFSRMA